MPEILQTKPSDWHYVSEGGATIVFSYKGPSHPDFEGTVLRLRKAPVFAGGHPSSAVSDEEEPDDPTIEFQTKCMRRLIPPEHLPRLESVWLDQSWLAELVRLQDGIRPETRRRKDQVDIKRKKGVLATDIVGGDWLAIEVKPKWAFLPSPLHLSEETRAIKTQTCRFCMHSRYKAQREHSKRTTDYCPLDLFSGCYNRVLKAIYCLWDAWVASDATANNLKIFAAGKFVHPSEAKQILADGYDEDVSTIRDLFATALVQPLLDTPILRILSELQRNLDALDIEGLAKLWRKVESAASMHGGADSASIAPLGHKSSFDLISDPSISDWNDFLDDYLSSERKKDMDHDHPSPEDLRHHLLAYLLSATFKDCSVIVRLDFLRPEEASLQKVKTRLDRATVIDLDPKKFDKLRGWEELDKAIVNEYSTVVERKICVDEWNKEISISPGRPCMNTGTCNQAC